MIEITISWRKSSPEKRGEDYKIALFDFGDEKTRAVVERLNELSANPMDVEKLLESWPLGDQEEVNLARLGSFLASLTEEMGDRELPVWISHYILNFLN